MQLWSINNEEGGWEEPRNNVEIVTIDGVQYYNVELSGRGLKNLDYIPTDKLVNVRVKAPRNMRIIDVQLSSTPSMMIASSSRIRKKENKAILSIPRTCPCAEPKLNVTAVDKKTGDTSILKKEVAANYKFKRRKGTCAQEPFLAIFRVRRHGFYRGYKLKNEDFIPLRGNKDAYTQQ
jgi:hypothetical protein